MRAPHPHAGPTLAGVTSGLAHFAPLRTLRRAAAPWVGAAVLLGGGAAAQVIELDPERTPVVDVRLPFAIERTADGAPRFVLGLNRFTVAQLATFVLEIEGFLADADAWRRTPEADRAPSARILSVRGEAGYVALAVPREERGPAYLLTLQGEAVRSFESDAALLATVSRLGRYLAVAGAPLRPPPAAVDPAGTPVPSGPR